MACRALTLVLALSASGQSLAAPEGTVCQSKLKAVCSQQGGTACETCALSHLKAFECTMREANTFCSGRPGPKPFLIKDECRTVLEKMCGPDQSNRAECETCLENNAKKDGCTLKEEFEFCDHGSEPAPAPAPGPEPFSCKHSLQMECNSTSRPPWNKNDTCIECVDQILADIHRRDPEAKCMAEGAKFKKDECKSGPTPISDKCIKLLSEDCIKYVAMPKDGNLCYNCTQKAISTMPDVACTPQEEFSFCEYGPKGEPKCVEELQKLCGKPWGSQHSNKTACLDCVIAHEKGGFWTKVNCTRAEVSKFC